MNNLVTVQMTILFDNKDSFIKGLQELIKDSWIIQKENGTYDLNSELAFLDEKFQPDPNVEVVSEEKLCISIFNTTIINGWTFIDKILRISKVYGKVYTVDDEYKFYQLNNIGTTLLDSKEIFSSFKLVGVQQSNEMTNEEKDEFNEDLDYALMNWISS